VPAVTLDRDVVPQYIIWSNISSHSRLNAANISLLQLTKPAAESNANQAQDVKQMQHRQHQVHAPFQYALQLWLPVFHLHKGEGCHEHDEFSQQQGRNGVHLLLGDMQMRKLC